MDFVAISALFAALIDRSDSCIATTPVTTPAVAACLGCAANLITLTTDAQGSKAMDGDVTDTTGTCATRTFTCLGANNPNININNGATTINDADDGATDGSTMLVVTCNAAGTAWENNGVAVTQLECAVETPCLMCAANLITITTAGNGAKPMDGDVTDTTGACAVRTFTCLGTAANMPNIETNAGVITDGSDGATDGSTMLVVTCNAAGTAWESNGVAITTVECAVTPSCLLCAANLITVTAAGAGAKPMDNDVTDTTGVCAVRTFTCLGTNPNIVNNNGVVIDGDDGAVDGSTMLEVTCNAAGTAWESNGVAITQVECAIPCQTCAANLITVTAAGNGAKPMDGDVTVTTGACAVRTFTCLGATNPNIEINNGGVTAIMDGDDGAVDGSTTLQVTCNAAGTAWESNGVAITQVECTIPCQTCAANLIAVTQALPGAKPFDGDVTVSTGACAVRTFTCLGSNPTIVNNNGAIMDGADGAVDGSTVLVLTCNAAGTAWESNGAAITTMECTIPCKTCAANLITVTQTLPGSKAMDGDVTVSTGACAVRTFTCLGTSATIEINGGATQMADGDDGATDGTATVVVTCNAAGTGWEVNGVAITNVECTLPCQTCAANLITITMAGFGAKPFDGDVTSTAGGCAVRTFTCLGANSPNIEINNGFGVISDGDDGAVDGSATFAVTCSADGTAWEVAGVTVTQVECSSIPPCQLCAANLITVTQTLPGAIAMGGDVTVNAGACAVRTFTCLGAVNPTIEINGGATQSADGDDGATDGTATVVATCNAAGTAWEVGGVAITNVECTIPCRTCAAGLITITMAGFGAKPMDGDVTVSTGACSVRTFTCLGAVQPNIEINGGLGTIMDGDDGAVDGRATFAVTCSADGTAWEAFGQPITQVECATF